MELASISQSLTQVCPPCTTARCLGTFSKSKRLFVANAATPSPKDTSSSSIVSRRRPSGEVRQKFQVCWTRCQNSSAVDNSPFTERTSPRKTHGRGLIPNISLPEERISDRCDDTSDDGHVRSLPARAASGESLRQFGDDQEGGNAHDLSEKSAQLPELREVLAMLREKRSEEAGTEKGRGCSGNVFLVGTGPGDPELLTVKAVRLMQSADLVLYDRLVSADILDLVHAGARLLYVGKTSGYHSRTQEEIHELLLSFAEAGATVVRLKGGDPLVFGRGGEEVDFLQNQGIQVNVIPGITAASGIAAELGIPLTHRGAANSVRFLTGHSRKGGEDPLYVAEQAADPDSTLVIYMGLATLPGLAAKLMNHGLSPDVPAAAVERGTTLQQRTVFGTLEALPELVKTAKLVSPTLIFIGKVVALSPLWPSNSCTEGRATRRHHPTPSAPAVGSRSAPRLVGEPRERLKRGPDPILPSQQ